MNIKLLCCGLMVSSLAVANPDTAPTNSVSVANMTDEALDLWINGEYRQLKQSTALFYPCLPGEKVEVQHLAKLEYLICGEKRGIEK